MGAFSFLRSVYDLDTLDTRFTTSSSTPYKTIVDTRSTSGTGKDTAAARIKSQAEPSKWNTPEFYLYLLVILWSVPSMFWVAYQVSTPSDPRYAKYEELLSPGWIPGRKIDVSDSQYSTFRTNLPYMGLLLTLHPLCRKVWNANFPAPAIPTKPTVAEQGSARLEQRASFDRAFAILFLVALHGISALKVLLILYTNYQLATKLKRQYVPVATWVFNIGILFANELCQGYRAESIASLIATPPVEEDLSGGEPFLVHWGAWLDSYGGLLSRWEILFNITILRLISFNLDYYWSLDRRNGNSIEKKQLDPANLSERDRVSIPAAPSDFSFRNYLAYAIYAPLYIAGPILTFNDYISQAKYRPATIETSRTIRYAVRFVLVLLAMEVILHYDYVGAISHADPVWSEYTPAQLSLLSFFNLHFIWLKLLLPWRLFRLWSLVDGIDPPENMIRCVSNNYSTKSFWKAWHRSYNRWLIRYIYLPLGGMSLRNWKTILRTIMTYILVFTFVAMWHDIELRLLIWGWLIVLFLLPELFAAYLFPQKKWENRPATYRLLCGLGAVANVLMMIMANLVGFAVGLDGLQAIITSIFKDWSGLAFLITAFVTLFAGIQIMFELRQTEMRKGVSLKC